jgi:antitoxin FitA
MPQLLVKQVEEKLVRKLKAQAGRHGVSMEEEHRRILREALLGRSKKMPSFKEYLLQMPDIEPDELFARKRDVGREVKLSPATRCCPCPRRSLTSGAA